MVERAILDPDGRRRVAPWAHGDIPGRDEPDQHAVGAITGLDAWLAERLREGDNITLAVNDDGSITINSSAVGGGGGGGASAINDLTDVDTATDPPAVDDVLAWDGVMWTPATLAALGAPSLSNATPHVLGTAAPGTSTEASRADHVHAMPSAADVGAAATAHVHSGADITSGTIASARLGSGGTGGGAKFLADDQTFKTVSASETLPVSIIDAKGDLIVGTGADTAARLPVGAPNGSPLVVDGTQSTGVRWAASEVVIAGCPPAATNDWTLLSSPFGTGTTGGTSIESSTAATDGSARLLPVTVLREVSVTGLGIEVTAGNSGASAVLRLGLFTSVAGRPGAPVVDVTAGIATTGAKELSVSSVTIQAGTYWAVIVCQALDAGGTNPRVRSCSAFSTSAPRTVVPVGAYQGNSWAAAIPGALSSSPTVTSTLGFVPQIWMKASW